jgi:hypothetical protein
MPIWAIAKNSDLPIVLRIVAQFIYGTRLGVKRC